MPYDPTRYETPQAEVLDARLARADKPGQHLWCVTAAWLLPDPRTVIDADTPQLMDQENLLMIAGPGCFKCERPFSNRLAKQPCRGSAHL